MPSLLAVLGLDASSFKAKLQESQKIAGQAGQRMGASLMGPLKEALGAFALGVVIRDAFTAADRMKNLSREFKVSTETVQEWDIAARRVGMTAEDMGNALNKLKKARAGAVASGDLGGFREFLIPMEALKDATISTEQVLERMIEVAGGSSITEAQDVAGMELMGKSGARILSAFTELHDLGPVTLLKDDEIDKMHEAIEGFEELKRQAGSLAGKGYIGATAAPASLWQTVKDLWNYGRGGGRGGPRFGEGQAWNEGMTVTGETGPDKLHGQVALGMTVNQVTQMKRVQLDIEEKIAQNAMKTMTAEQRRAALNADISKHLKASEKAFEDAEWLKGYEEQLKAEQLRGELLAIKDPRAANRTVNALQTIGAYAAESPHEAQMLGATVRSEGHLREIKDYLVRKDGKTTNRGVTF